MNQTVESMDELVREYLLFRGFAQALSAFDQERKNDKSMVYNVDQIVDALVQRVQNFELFSFLELWDFLESRFFAQLDGNYVSTVQRLGDSLRRYYVINAMQSGRPDKVAHFFEVCAERFDLPQDTSWNSWFVLPYIQSPEDNPAFDPYFTRQWFETFSASLRNFLVTVFAHIDPPRLLRFRQDRMLRQTLESDLMAARAELNRLRTQRSLSMASTGRMSPFRTASPAIQVTTPGPRGESDAAQRPVVPHPTTEPVSDTEGAAVGEVIGRSDLDGSEVIALAEAGEMVSSLKQQFSVVTEKTLGGHASGLTCCRFSGMEGGATCLATGSRDGTVRVWDIDDGVDSFDGDGRRRASILCEGEVLCLDWESRSNRLLFVGTANRRVRIWNADAKRILGEAKIVGAYPQVTAVKCSPVESLFVCGCASGSRRTGSLTAWNVKTMKQQITFNLDPVPTGSLALCFNHNGSVLFSGGVDGMIRVFDVHGGMALMGWAAHEGFVSALALGPDETILFSAGSDGMVVQWSIHGMGRAMQSLDVRALASDRKQQEGDGMPGMGMAVDPEAGLLLAADGSGSALLFRMDDWAAPPACVGRHTGPVNVVDWHPGRLACVTASGPPDSAVQLHRIEIGQDPLVIPT